MGGALLGKLLGFLREVMMAQVFGASAIADGFRASVTAVQLPLVPFLSESVSAIIIPLQHHWNQRCRAPIMLTGLVLALGLASFVLMLAVLLMGTFWLKLLVGRFDQHNIALVVDFTRIMALSMPAIVMYECLASSDIANGRSGLVAVRAAVLNLFVIAGIALYAITGDLSALPWMFTASSNALLVWAFFVLRRTGAIDLRGARPGIIAAAFREFFHRLKPLMSLPLFQQANTWIERLVASGLAVGTIASLDYARTLTDTASLLIAQPIGMAVLYRGSSKQSVENVLAMALPILIIAIPVSIFLAAFATDVVGIVFQRGAFDEKAVAQTAGGVRGIALGLWAGTLAIPLTRFLNNSGRNRRVALIIGISFIISIALNALTAKFAVQDSNGPLLLGLAEGVRSIALMIAVALALDCLGGLLRILGSCLLASAAMTAVFALIFASCASSLTRLTFGGVACFATILALFQIMMPAHVLTFRGYLARTR